MSGTDPLDQILLTAYAGKVVRKDLLHQIRGGENVPNYALEYLLGRYRASDDSEEIRLDSIDRIEVRFLAAMLSALGHRRVQAGTLVLGDLTIQGNVKALPSITEVLQLALDTGAQRALLPTGNKSQFGGLPEEVVEKLDVVFYSEVDRAVAKVIEL